MAADCFGHSAIGRVPLRRHADRRDVFNTNNYTIYLYRINIICIELIALLSDALNACTSIR